MGCRLNCASIGRCGAVVKSGTQPIQSPNIELHNLFLVYSVNKNINRNILNC